MYLFDKCTHFPTGLVSIVVLTPFWNFFRTTIVVLLNVIYSHPILLSFYCFFFLLFFGFSWLSVVEIRFKSHKCRFYFYLFSAVKHSCFLVYYCNRTECIVEQGISFQQRVFSPLCFFSGNKFMLNHADQIAFRWACLTRSYPQFFWTSTIKMSGLIEILGKYNQFFDIHLFCSVHCFSDVAFLSLFKC